mmetsp:Transcript_20929/g.34541  ORF Transcript_20929/g.34541 Transcript_20929/m.34541 type:complete len:859 (+) Transcript_20929:181-2757(+)
MIATATEFQSHPNISAIYDDMVRETVSPSLSPVQHSRAHVQTFTVCTKTFDGADVSPGSTSDEGTKTFIAIDTKTFDGSAANLPKKTEKRSFSRKNSTDSLGVMSEQQKPSVRPVNRNFSRKNSTDSAFSIYNDDDLWCQRIGEIMNREVAAPPPSTSQEQHQLPVDKTSVSSSSSQPKIRRSQSTDCPFTMLQSQQGREGAWLKKQQFGGNLSRRNSMEGGNNTMFARKNSRSTSPKFIPPLDSFDKNGTSVAPSESKGGFSRRNSMTRSRSPKFVEPHDSSDHDESRVFKGRVRRHTHAAPNPSLSRQLETLRESRVSGEGSSMHYFAEQVKQRLEGLEEPSTPKAGTKNEQNTVPKKPFSRHNSVEGVDPSIFPSLPMLDKSVSSDDTDANFDLALLFERLVKEDAADDNASASSDEEDEEERVIIQRHTKSKMRRRCSTGGLRSFERENFRNFIEDTEGDEPPVRSVPEPDRKGSLFRKCSTGGLRTLQRENSRDLYSDDCSLDGKEKGRVHVSDDTVFNAYLKKLTLEADVDTSNDAKIIDQHVGGAVRRRSSLLSVSSNAEGAEDPGDFAAFISRVGQGVSSSQTVSTAANTSCSSDSYGESRQTETVRVYSKPTFPHSIQMLPLDESVSSIESPKMKDSQVNFRSSKSRSIRRLVSTDGIAELRKLAECLEPPIEPPSTRRSSYGGIRTPDEEEIVVKNLPRLIKKIDRDLVSEKAAYRKRSSGSEPIPKKERSPNAVKPRRPLEPPGTPASCISEKDDEPKHRKPQKTHCMQDSYILIEEVPLVSGMGRYKPRRSSTKSISEDRERFGEQGKSFDGNERKRKEQTKNSPHREGNIAIKSMRRKSSSGASF